jgi:predicted transport protein
MATSPEEGMASLIRNLEAKTGKSMGEWIEIARGSGLGKHKEIVEWLKTNHGLTFGYANQISQRALAAADAPEAGSDELVDAQFTGAKAAMRPLYDLLLNQVKALGADVEISPKKTCVSFRRNKQFGLVQATAQRLDVGIMLKGTPPAGRLEQNPTTMVTHRVKVSTAAEIDAELMGWMKQAYDAC